MAWCRQTRSHNLSQCWPESLSPYDVTRPQWVKDQLKNNFLSMRFSPPREQRPSDDIDSWHFMKWKHFPHYLPFVRGIHWSPTDSPHKGQWCGALMFSLMCVWTNDWANNRDAGDLWHHCNVDIDPPWKCCINASLMPRQWSLLSGPPQNVMSCWSAGPQWVNTLRPRQNGHHFADDTFKYIFLNANVMISAKISLKYVPKGPINNIPALVQIMAWRRSGNKALSETMMVRLPTHICITRPQWVNELHQMNDKKQYLHNRFYKP